MPSPFENFIIISSRFLSPVCNLPDSRLEHQSDRRSTSYDRKHDRKHGRKHDRKHKRKKSKRDKNKSKHGGGRNRRGDRKVKFSDRQAVKDRARLRRQLRKLRAHARRSADNNEDRDYRRRESLSEDSDLSDYEYHDYQKPDGMISKLSVYIS